jgi:hypothetical protein
MTTLYKPKAKYCESGNSLFRIFLQNSISEYRKSFFLILLVFGCVVKSYADCTAPTGTYTWASYLTGAGAGCTGILTIPNGATITLGASSSPEIVNIPAAITRIVIQSGGRISFTGKGQLKLPVGTSISIAQTSPTSGAGAAISGDCNNNNEIWIGTLQYAVCAGGNACVTFSALISSGGTTIINPTITVSGGSGNTICFNNFGLNSVLSGYIGGTPTYSWSQTAGPGTSSFSPGTSVASPSVTVSTPGTYSYRITVTSPLSSNCASTVSTSTADVTVTVRPTPTATIGETTTVCQNSTAQLVTFNNPQNIPVQISYSLNGIPQPPVSVGASTSATVSAPTTVAGSFVYTLNSVQYQVAPFCTNSVSGSATVTINGITPGTISKGAVNPGPACAPLDPNQTMAANSATAATGSAPTLTYLWEQSINGGAWTAASIVSPETSNTGVQFNPGPMNETTKLRRIATSTVNGVACSAVSNELEYVVYPLPVVAAITPTGTINVCEGSTVQLTNATSGGVWRSNNGANVTVSSTGLVTGVSAAAQTSLNISYTVTNSNGCVTTVNRTVNVIALPTVTSASAVCVGNTFNLTPNTGGTWISNNPTIATVTSAGLVTGVAPGSATFTFTNTAAPNCSKTTSAVSVTPKPTATINSANTSVCDGASTNITGTVTATGAWTITLSNGATATGTGNGTFSITVTPSSNAIYTITSLIDANCSAISTDLTGSTIVNVKPKPTAPTVTVVDNCDGSSTLTASAYSGTLLWSTGETAESINVLTAGNYSVTHTVDGCVSPGANATAAPKSTPIAPTVTVVDNCDGTSTLTASAYSGTLLWSTGETAESINVLTAGNYSVTQTVDGCVSPEANATAAPKSTPIAPTVTVVDNCEGTSTLTASAYSGTLLWSTGETAESINVLTAGNYSVTQTVDGRVSPVANATAVPKSTPIAPAVASRREFCKDEEITALTATGTNLLWYENAVTGIGSSTAIIPQTSVVGTSTYYVTQTINGCESERAAIEVVIKAECFELPVILSEFKVRKQEQTVLISWKTTREINSDRFEIERSTDPKNSFEKIATVKSHDTESGAQYQFEDNQLPQAESVYYRLKMIDQDETFSYSKIQSVKAEQYIVTEIYPNPTSDYINIKTSNWKNVQSFNILDMNGTSVLNFTGSHLSSKIDISKLKSGNYLIDIIRKDGKTDCKRFVIIR